MAQGQGTAAQGGFPAGYLHCIARGSAVLQHTLFTVPPGVVPHGVTCWDEAPGASSGSLAPELREAGRTLGPLTTLASWGATSHCRKGLSTLPGWELET